MLSSVKNELKPNDYVNKEVIAYAEIRPMVHLNSEGIIIKKESKGIILPIVDFYYDSKHAKIYISNRIWEANGSLRLIPESEIVKYILKESYVG